MIVKTSENSAGTAGEPETKEEVQVVPVVASVVEQWDALYLEQLDAMVKDIMSILE